MTLKRILHELLWNFISWMCLAVSVNYANTKGKFPGDSCGLCWETKCTITLLIYVFLNKNLNNLHYPWLFGCLRVFFCVCSSKVCAFCCSSSSYKLYSFNWAKGKGNIGYPYLLVRMGHWFLLCILMRSQSSLFSLDCNPSIAQLTDSGCSIKRYLANVHVTNITRFPPYCVDVTKCLSDTKHKPQPIK